MESGRSLKHDGALHFLIFENGAIHLQGLIHVGEVLCILLYMRLVLHGIRWPYDLHFLTIVSHTSKFITSKIIVQVLKIFMLAEKQRGNTLRDKISLIQVQIEVSIELLREQ